MKKHWNFMVLGCFCVLGYQCEKLEFEDQRTPVEPPEINREWYEEYEIIENIPSVFGIFSIAPYNDTSIIAGCAVYRMDKKFPFKIVSAKKEENFTFEDLKNGKLNYRLKYQYENYSIWENEYSIIRFKESDDRRNVAEVMSKAHCKKNSFYLSYNNSSIIIEGGGVRLENDESGIFVYNRDSLRKIQHLSLEYFESLIINDYLWISNLPGTKVEKKGQLLRFDFRNRIWDTMFTQEGSGLWMAGFGIQASKDKLWMGILSRGGVGNEFGGGLVQFKGISNYDPQNIEESFQTTSDFINHHTGNSILKSNSVCEVFVDSKDRVWIGTYGGGLYRIDENDKWQVYTDTTSSNKNSYEQITELSNGEIWAKKWNYNFTVFRPKK